MLYEMLSSAAVAVVLQVAPRIFIFIHCGVPREPALQAEPPSARGGSRLVQHSLVAMLPPEMDPDALMAEIFCWHRLAVASAVAHSHSSARQAVIRS